MYNQNDPDPLGISASIRGLQNRFDLGVQDPGYRLAMMNSLPDPKWEGFFQRLQDNGANRVRQGPGGGQFGPLPSTFNPQFQQSALSGLRNAHPTVGGTSPNEAPMPQSHESFMDSNPAAQAQIGMRQQAIRDPRRRGAGQPVVGQRGTSGNNQSQRYRQPNPNEGY